jgi:TolB-like protein/DNA-binding winged helix-turn-helix (wHTH) protein/Flp pilus assembly protein TadD
MTSSNSMNNLRGRVFEFGLFRLDTGQRMLWRESEPLPLSPKEFETLLVLVEAGGQSVGKEAIISRVWPDTFVSDSSLTRNISVLRKLLGDDVIQTLPKFGYRLTLPVGQPPVAAAAAPQPPIAMPDASVRLPEPDGESDRHRAADVAAERPGSGPGPAGIAPAHRPRGKVWAALALLIATGAFFAHREAEHSRAKPQTVTGPIRIAVLPFVNLTGDEQQEYVCDGLTEAMISELSRVSPGHLDVIARTSAMQYKHSNKAVPEIGRELGVGYVLESSVRESGRRVRVTTQLVRAADAGHVWTGEYDRDFKDVLSAQQAVAISIAREIELTLGPASGARHEPAVDAEAYRSYLLGRFYWNQRSREGLLQSVEYFQQAIERDPDYARAYAGLADAYLVLGGGYLPDRESYDKGKVAATRALELDPTLAEAYCSLAYEKYVNERDWQGADEDYQRAISLDPGYATAHHWYALYLAAMLRQAEALREIRRALDLDPLSVAINYGAGSILTQAGRYDEAAVQLQRALEIDPNNAMTHGGLAVVYERKRLYERAASEFETAQRLSGGYSPYAVELVHVYALEGQVPKARAVLRGLLADGKWAEVSPLSFARAYIALGEKKEAFRWLQRSIDDHSCTVAEINTDRDLDALRSDPRFEEIRHRFHLPNP